MENFENKNTFQAQQFSINKICFLLIAIIIVYGLHLRVAAINKTEIDGPIRADAYQYYHYAKNISESGVYSQQVINDGALKPDALRPPGFPFFASMFISNEVKRTLDNTLWAQTILQIFSFALVSIVFFKILAGWWGILAISFLWTFPHFVSINSYYLSESLFTSFLSIILFCAWYFSIESKNHIRGIMVCGFLLGLAALIRPVVEYFPFFLIVVAILLRPDLIRRAFLFAVFASIPVVVWKIRNVIVLDMWSDSSLMINALYHGSFPDMMFNNDITTRGAAYKFDPDQQKMTVNVVTTISLIWQKIIGSPVEYINWYLIGKQMFLWQWSVLTGHGDIYIYQIINSPYKYLPDMKVTHAFHQLIHNTWVIIGLMTSFIIVILSWLKKINILSIWILISLFIIYIVLMHIIIAPYPRYGIPFKIFLMPLGILGLLNIIKMSKQLWIRVQKS